MRQRTISLPQSECHARSSLVAEFTVEDQEELTCVTGIIWRTTLSAAGQLRACVQSLSFLQKVHAHHFNSVEINRTSNVSPLVFICKAAVNDTKALDAVRVPSLEQICERIWRDTHKPIAFNGMAWQRLEVLFKSAKPWQARRRTNICTALTSERHGVCASWTPDTGQQLTERGAHR